MKIGFQQKVHSLKTGVMFVAVALVAAVSVTGSVSAESGPKYFDVSKGSPQKVCYKQLDAGWKALGFKNLDHCLRYVATPAPEVKSDCNAGWWYVYGFNSIGHCKLWVTLHGGGGYDGDDDPNAHY